jgi:hypothetical protein
MSTVLGNPKISPEALATMCERGGEWFAYQSHDMSSRTLGDLQFLQCGLGRTYSEPPARMPDTAQSINWRYMLAGEVNLETGEIQEIWSISKIQTGGNDGN